SAYLPVIDLCRSYFRIEARDDARSIREKVTGKLLTLDESLRAMVPGFLSLLDVPTDDASWDALDPRQRLRRTVDGPRRMLLGEAEELDPLKHLLVEQAEGVPLFLEESVRTLVESEAITGDRGAYRLARPFDTIRVPATVQAILAARIDRLSPEDKTLLQTAA